MRKRLRSVKRYAGLPEHYRGIIIRPRAEDEIVPGKAHGSVKEQWRPVFEKLGQPVPEVQA